ncbi:MAG: hypothetical protein HY558_06080 [Euryarchaeota archaeon]|nr:hypothetical protein [Euryarchaeota archaeon]
MMAEDLRARLIASRKGLVSVAQEQARRGIVSGQTVEKLKDLSRKGEQASGGNQTT